MPPEQGDEWRAWVALASVRGIGEVTFERLLTTFGSAAAALEGVARLPVRRGDRSIARRLGLRVDDGLHGRVLAAARDIDGVTRVMTELGGWLVTPLEEGYPERLHVLEHPPRVLFGLGDAAAATAPRSIAVVGTRRPTAVGRTLAMRVAARLVESQTVVVSGLAVGIDSAAHVSTLDRGGRTVAVVGGGLDAPGPALNRRLARAIIAHGGAILSEHAPGIGPTRGTFPKRNRLISALTTGTIVIEAPARSGALITARHALEQGRTLLVAPGRPSDPSVAGCLAFLRETPAQALVGLDEMLVDLGLDEKAEAGPGKTTAALSATAALEMLPPTERSVAAALMDGPQTMDAIVDRCALAPGVVSAALTILQMRGWARVHGSIQLASGPLLDTRGVGG